MDTNAQFIAGLSMLSGSLLAIIAMFNHKKITIKCCKKELSASFSVDEATPPIDESNKKQGTIVPASSSL